MMIFFFLFSFLLFFWNEIWGKEDDGAFLYCHQSTIVE